MEFNKIAAAVLVTLLAVMVISKVGNYLVPTETTHASGPIDTGQTGPADGGEEPAEGPFTDYIAEASVDRGQAAANNCLSCHTLNEGGAARQGPNLYGVVGRDKGSVEGFNYSSALAEAGGEWTYQELFEYLRNPQAVFSGSQMYFRLNDPVQRASVILYLRTLDDNPPALPEATTPAEEGGDQGVEDASDGGGEDAAQGGQQGNGQGQEEGSQEGGSQEGGAE